MTCFFVGFPTVTKKSDYTLSSVDAQLLEMHVSIVTLWLLSLRPFNLLVKLGQLIDH